MPVLAQRISYAGELGWELYAEAAIGRRLWDVIWKAGGPFGLVAAGRAAYDGLRMEKGYRSWGLDMTEEDDPYEAGIGFTVKLGKGRLRGHGRARGEEGRRSPARAGLGRARTIRPMSSWARSPCGSRVTTPSSATSAAPPTATASGACLTSVMLPVELAAPDTRLTIEWFGERLPATVVKDPVWDPAGERIRA